MLPRRQAATQCPQPSAGLWRVSLPNFITNPVRPGSLAWFLSATELVKVKERRRRNNTRQVLTRGPRLEGRLKLGRCDRATRLPELEMSLEFSINIKPTRGSDVALFPGRFCTASAGRPVRCQCSDASDRRELKYTTLSALGWA